MTEQADATTRDTGTMVAEALARGDQRFDPVRFRVIEAMARRAASLDGEVRRIVDDKVIALLAAYGEDLEKAKAAEVTKQQAQPERDAFADLIEHIARHAPAADDVPADVSAIAAAKTTAPGKAAPRPRSSPSVAPAPAAELKSIRYFKSTWSRLSADRRLNQSLAKVPQNAGPLNSHQLVHRSLTLMRDMSPEYLNRFMAYVDALSWVEQLNGGGATAANAASPRGEGTKKSGRGSKGS
ncbi:hypothetical protein FHT32_000281 [Variovorax sp. SG517]|uniref:DUF2894 domain-containing protein n=1 Tax=Variovorax sp. SG517 TaxID=2587117 RepID=UPI0017E831E7|nr:hypothetical protein [Variovorax sp. SG517]